MMIIEFMVYYNYVVFNSIYGSQLVGVFQIGRTQRFYKCFSDLLKIEHHDTMIAVLMTDDGT